uniref:Large ribosomal subunit protein uL23c n=1 Tax=Bulboplastis apyrenoidosa TaxID=1070855 RepID=A0A1Y9TMA7_9RHOD|nr:50S ribosomal protein L23 [Bulboplastis apyrenoidosa]ARO90782.1 50S ribosomal protein L23 [Bulboplastis apyrenoidosa]
MRIVSLKLMICKSIKYPIITDKTTRLLENNQYSFFVGVRHSKTEIKQSIEQIFDVKVVAVNTYKVPKKKRIIGRFKGYKSQYKRAIVTLADNNSIQLFPET